MSRGGVVSTLLGKEGKVGLRPGKAEWSLRTLEASAERIEEYKGWCARVMDDAIIRRVRSCR